jgi:hypothetical protein
MKSLAGSSPIGSFNDGKVQPEAFTVALAERTAAWSSVKGRFARIMRALKDVKVETFADPVASRILIPLTLNALSGCTRDGGAAKSNVKHVSRSSDANERGGHGLQRLPSLSDL